MGVTHHRTTTIEVSQVTPKNFYILETRSSTTETKDELSKCLGLCLYQLQLLGFVHQGEVTVLEMICKPAHTREEQAEQVYLGRDRGFKEHLIFIYEN